MSNLPITLAVWDYDSVRPLLDGRVPVEGCDVNYVVLPPEECFRRAYLLKEFEVSEIGFVPYVLARSLGVAPYTALPVFLSRMFRHSAIYVRTDRGIVAPGDLIGKRVGVVEYQMSAVMWCRGMLDDEYGVRPDAVFWRQGGANVPGRTEKFPLSLPPGFPLEPIPAGSTLNEQLTEGHLDAVISPEVPNCFEDGKTPVRRLFADFEATERAYYRRSGHFPIMHALGIRNDVLERNPWLPARLYASFCQAKRIANRELFELRAPKIGLPWIVAHAMSTDAVMGKDFWSYGVEANRETLETTLRYAHDHGLTSRRLTVDELFPLEYEAFGRGDPEVVGRASVCPQKNPEQ